MSTKTKQSKKPRPRYRVQLVKSIITGLWYHLIVGSNGEKIACSELYDAKNSSNSRSNARRAAKALASALGAEIEVVGEAE